MLGRVLTRAREAYEEHRDFTLLALLFASFRLMALLVFEPGGYILDWSGYYIPGANFVQLSDMGFYPVVHYWIEYPPVFPWLAVFVYRLSMLLPAWREASLWFDFLLGSTFLVFEVGNFFLIYAIALKLWGRDGAVRCAWLYAGLFFPLMTLLFWFDNLPLFFLLLGIYMVITKRPLVGGIAAGIGFMIKLVPAFVAPVALRVFPKRSQKVTYAVAAISLALLIALPFLLTNATFLLTTFLRLGSVAPWETVWALLDGYYTGGEAVPLRMRFDPTNVIVSFHESRFPYLPVALAAAAIYLVLYTRRIDWQDELKAVTFCGLSVGLFLVFSRGYSPQWMVNLLPFIVLLMPDLRGVAYSILLMGANVLEFPVALVLVEGHPWLFVVAVILRAVLIVLVTVEFGLILFPSSRGKRALGLALVSVVLLVLLGALPVAALAVRDYSAERYAESAYTQTIDYLTVQPGGGVIFTDPGLYRQLYGFLVGRQGLYLVEATEHLPSTLARLLDRHRVLYVVYAGSEDDERSNPSVEEWLGEHAFPVSVEWLGNARLTRYSVPPSALHEQPVLASFADRIELAACSLDAEPLQPGDILHVSLSWRSIRPVEIDYTVFVHLVDEDNRVWTQHDSHPVGGLRPTSSWKAGEEITDNHGLALPPDIPPGEYRLALGLYDAVSGQRLPVTNAEPGAPSDGVLVGPVLVGTTDR